ncbi:hypothetical protein RD792_003542 [Penstemon davidsonii]|uniref:Thioredoxin domain-containing protein n=1 Tax=Penstemon davidsonii TaxID=160366 RepID=A0ABR0DU40_9LAMI|nr:hypothetical protein RD792_003542 [Penstemon davidsonii]
MSCCLKADFSITIPNSRDGESLRVCSSIGSLQFKESYSSKEFLGKTLDGSHYKPLKLDPVNAQSSVCISKALKWWEKSLEANMIEIHSAQQLVDALLNAGDKLVVVDFYAPGCGGCKALHPKICQLAELNPNTLFLKVNYEQLKAMCYALHVHVLPFFRFYRGAKGKVCSFSCTNATVSVSSHINLSFLINLLLYFNWNFFGYIYIKKFKGALEKYGTERCSLGPAKGLDETEILALSSIGQIKRDLVPSFDKVEEELVLNNGFKEGNAMAVV